VIVFVVALGLQLPAGNGLTAALLALAIAAAVYLIAFIFIRLVEERSTLQDQIMVTERQAQDARQRLAAVLRLSQKIVEAHEEREVVDLVLHLSVELVGATAASFVPLDERGQPMTAVSFGDLPAPVLNDWVEYLASPAIRHRCGACQHYGSLMAICPVLAGPSAVALGAGLPEHPAPIEMYCLPLRWGEREFGVLNLYLPAGRRLDHAAQTFLRTILDETALALEGVRLRRREMAALRQLQVVRRRTDLTGVLEVFLENVCESLQADFAFLTLCGSPGEHNSPTLATGRAPEKARQFVDGILQEVIASGNPLRMGSGSASLSSNHPWQSILAVPLQSEDRKVLGAILVGNIKGSSFSQRQLALLQTVAGQVVLVVQNIQVMAELEYKSIISERNRLAREIHDGLAQTLGFLKLQTAQMQNYLSQGELERLAESLRAANKVLAEAYLDARQAIEGLRMNSEDEGLSSWLEQTVLEFQENSGLQVNLEGVQVTAGLASEVQAQLIRIVQEALSNIRKHAQASQVWVSFRVDNGDLIMEVRDDGHGFSPEDIPGPSRYGLQSMRERAELIGADFQVISRQNEGTTVLVRLPLMVLRRIGERTG
jgi:two-component system, NarL family, nitrate/nitrite sensor histidine kinase NarX